MQVHDFVDNDFVLPKERPLTLASYAAGIFYRPLENGVEIVRILHGARLASNH